MLLLFARCPLHFLELRKLREEAVGLEQRLVRWMLFLSARSRERMGELAKAERLLLAKRLMEMEDSIEKIMEVAGLSRAELQHLLPHFIKFLGAK